MRPIFAHVPDEIHRAWQAAAVFVSSSFLSEICPCHHWMINSASASQTPSSFRAGNFLSSIHILMVLQDRPTKLQMSFLPLTMGCPDWLLIGFLTRCQDPLWHGSLTEMRLASPAGLSPSLRDTTSSSVI
jgi:hypothetical protein